jgi:hypothetical protein
MTDGADTPAPKYVPTPHLFVLSSSPPTAQLRQRCGRTRGKHHRTMWSKPPHRAYQAFLLQTYSLPLHICNESKALYHCQSGFKPATKTITKKHAKKSPQTFRCGLNPISLRGDWRRRNKYIAAQHSGLLFCMNISYEAHSRRSIAANLLCTKAASKSCLGRAGLTHRMRLCKHVQREAALGNRLQRRRIVKTCIEQANADNMRNQRHIGQGKLIAVCVSPR